ncbi:SMP-30/gluconolactonase/LRE family protein [Solihabitans fulvus]|uniref:SMP-30/gluconolactonase/LRE family protein n=1 Tax=Solihabitans fulvus TaxID=1892852 RepID=A0A5B2XUW0_9PSEU|nr:SMP-30/gluconolactonase/LRE family protein [Solihabitans fulvus]KAA2266584.1 SMP-30/gluconolactonase/LRE family protein [Solihabitans fulvus]
MRLIPINGRGPEDIAVDADGDLLTGVADGRILRVDPDGSRIATVADTGGRPLGIEIAKDGHLVVCDARRGLLTVDPRTGTVRTLVDRVDGERMLLCDNATVLPDGTIYFTDSSRTHDLAHYSGDLLAHRGTGRLLRRDPDGSVTVLLTRLQFANGVTASADGSYVAVAETGGYRITRLWLGGPHAGEADVLADDLPGFPDNLSTGRHDTIWAALPQPRNPALALLHRVPPTARRAAAPIAAALAKRPPRTSGLLGLDGAGRITRHVRLVGGGYRSVTGVRQHDDLLYLGSLVESAIAVLDVPIERRTTVNTRLAT